MRRRHLVLSAAAAMVAACTKPADAVLSPTNYPTELAAKPATDIWPAGYHAAPKAVQTAYHYAADNYETLRYIPCFCGCGLSSGHLNNYDCFVKSAKSDGWYMLDPHGLGCGTCVAITLEVIAMRNQRMNLKAIRASIEGRWGQTGPPTRTPYP